MIVNRRAEGSKFPAERCSRTQEPRRPFVGHSGKRSSGSRPSSAPAHQLVSGAVSVISAASRLVDLALHSAASWPYSASVRRACTYFEPFVNTCLELALSPGAGPAVRHLCSITHHELSPTITVVVGRQRGFSMPPNGTKAAAPACRSGPTYRVSVRWWLSSSRVLNSLAACRSWSVPP